MAKGRERAGILAKATDEVRPSAYLDYRVYLAALYEAVKRQHDGDYSWQRLADDLGFGATTALHQIARGYRPLTEKTVERIIKRLGLTGVERRYLLALVRHQHARSAATRQAAFEELLELKERVLPDEVDKDTLAFYAEWYHPVIREMCGGGGLVDDPAAITDRLLPRLRPEQVKDSLALLARLGLVTLDSATQTWRQTQTRISTGHRVKGLALVGYHLAMIEQAREALQTVPGRRRDVSAMTLCVDESALARLKAMIHAFQSSILDEAERHPGDQVFQVNVQLFPLTEEKKRKAE
jgi:uncharacterized protein (TIGR02147 family)